MPFEESEEKIIRDFYKFAREASPEIREKLLAIIELIRADKPMKKADTAIDTETTRHG